MTEFKIVKRDKTYHNLRVKNLVADNFILNTPRYWAATLSTDTQINAFPDSVDYLKTKVVKFDTDYINPGNFYDSSTGIFTVPVDGHYNFDVEVNYIASGATIGNIISTELIRQESATVNKLQVKSVRRNLTLTNGQIYDEVFSVVTPVRKNEQYYVGILYNNISLDILRVNPLNAFVGGLIGQFGLTRSNLRITRL